MLPKQLMFTVGLIDQITKPIAKISKQFNGLANGYQQGTMKMASGAAGMASAGYALSNAMKPAIEMDRALGEVKSLGVRDSALKELTNTAYDFSLKYGKSSTDFIKSSYDIQSAISGLNDADLSAFTLSSNVLATATKADAATITNYMGTMYGIFKNQAEGMGKTQWVEQVTGMTATAVQMFKTTGGEMSGAFTAIGAEATSAGIGINEQMAILGKLQATMSGSEAGTKYKAFLSGVGKAQKQLGLEFTDSHGQMLPMVDILNKIKGKFGETIDVAEGDALKKAFGSSKEAVATVKLLMNDIGGLNGSIEQLGKVKGMQQAEKMAAAMTDQSERLGASWFVIRAAFGTAILPVFNSMASWLANVGRDLVSFTEKYPTLTKYIGYAAMGLLGLVAAGGLFTLMMGAGQMAMTAWGVGAMAWSGITTVLSFGMSTLRSVMLALNIAMYANPIGLIVAGIAAAVLAVGALIYYWDDLKAAMSDWGWIEAITGVFSSVWSGVKSIFTSYLNWWIDKINMIPGVEIDLISSNKSEPNIDSVSSLAKDTKQARETKKTHDNIVPFAQLKQNLTSEQLSQISQLSQANGSYKTSKMATELSKQTQQNTVVPFTQPIVDAEVIKQTQANKVTAFSQPVIPAALAGQSQPITVVPESLKPISIVNRQEDKANSVLEIPALKLERTKVQPSFVANSNSNANSTDNSKRVFIDNITMKSDDINRDFDQLLELAG